MTDRYDLTAHLHCSEQKPPGVMTARVKAAHVVTVHPHPRARAHRPVYAVTANVDGEFVLGARFACGSASIRVRPVDEATGHITLCPACERVAEGRETTFAVYAYYDALGQVLYIGQTCDLDSRHKAHRGDRRSARWFAQAEHRAILSEHTTREAALRAEAVAIATLEPLFNINRPLHLVQGGAA